LIIPNSVTSIGNSAFSSNQLEEIISEAAIPPVIEFNSFGDRRVTVLRVPVGKVQDYINASYTGFKEVIDTFRVDNIEYSITGATTVSAVDYNVAGGTSVEIPSTVVIEGVTYSVTAIGDNAFEGNELTNAIIPNSVTSIGIGAFSNNRLNTILIPNSVTQIGVNAFRRNILSNITIPNSVVSIGNSAFRLTNIDTVISEAIIPPSIEAETFGFSRNLITLHVPNNRREDYINAGWVGFKSIIEEISETNFQVQTTGQSCPNVANGSIEITANDTTLNYRVRVTGQGFDESQNFSDSSLFSELNTGEYSVEITTPDIPLFIQRMTVLVKETERILVEEELFSSAKTLNLTLSGSSLYEINFNEETFFTSNNISLDLIEGENTISVKTNKDCQGIYSNKIQIGGPLLSVFPNPIEDKATISLNTGLNTQIDILDVSGKIVRSSLVIPENQTVILDCHQLPSGVYFLKVVSTEINEIKRIIKK